MICPLTCIELQGGCLCGHERGLMGHKRIESEICFKSDGGMLGGEKEHNAMLELKHNWLPIQPGNCGVMDFRW